MGLYVRFFNIFANIISGKNAFKILIRTTGRTERLFKVLTKVHDVQ